MVPASVTVKSEIVESRGIIFSVVNNIEKNLADRQGIFLVLLMFILFSYSILENTSQRKNVALITIIACFLHILAGKFGWYNRYEIYIWSFSLLIGIYLFGPKLTFLIEKAKNNRKLDKVIFLIITLTAIIGSEYITDIFSIPLASNNVYEQQYQMHRFVTDYYKKPVAVNDLGYVSYKNRNYVLDLWGLASIKAYKSRINDNNKEWIANITGNHNVKLAMIYHDAFKEIPHEWLKIGELHLGKKKITADRLFVDFYATDKDEYIYIVEKLNDFIKTLPKGVLFTFKKHDNLDSKELVLHS
jgi:hypothetical protein